MILFFSKSRIGSKETKLYGFMLISSFFDVILVLAELTITYYFLDDVNMYLVKGLNRIDFIHYIMWPTLLSLYTIYVTYLDEEKYNKTTVRYKITMRGNSGWYTEGSWNTEYLREWMDFKVCINAPEHQRLYKADMRLSLIHI